MNTHPRTKPMVCLADWDGTLRPGYTVQDWLPFLANKFQIGPDHEEALNKVFLSYRNGTITYEQLVGEAAIVHARALAGLSITSVANAAAEFVAGDRKLFAYTRKWFDTLRNHNISVIIVSGAPYEVLNAYAALLDLSQVFALRICRDNNACYTSGVEINYGCYDDKSVIANKVAGEADILLALGNSFSDSPLFAVAQKGFFIVDEATKVDALKQDQSIRSLNVQCMTPEQMLEHEEAQQWLRSL
jgi:phosphoserine phosphatase